MADYMTEREGQIEFYQTVLPRVDKPMIIIKLEYRLLQVN